MPTARVAVEAVVRLTERLVDLADFADEARIEAAFLVGAVYVRTREADGAAARDGADAEATRGAGAAARLAPVERRKVGFWLEAEEFDFRLELDAIRFLNLLVYVLDD